MAKQFTETQHAAFTFRYRAVCNCGFDGPWRTDIKVARQDALSHLEAPGNEGHETRVITEQTSSVTSMVIKNK